MKQPLKTNMDTAPVINLLPADSTGNRVNMELDKFKRRVIRSVARKIFNSDKTEDELWAELKVETGCDCKILWHRMRALTLKKLKRLLMADDRLENIIPAAQMSLSDWLLFDLVLVHEDIDVIDRDFRSPSARTGTLQELLDLIDEFNVEGKQGEELVAAWTQVTYIYNNRGRQCSPMLLQKRWYQVKKQVRIDFYRFWYNYRGNVRLIEKTKNYIPSHFEMAIAKRYPYIITKPFLEWKKLVEAKSIILPEEFENKFRSQNIPTSKTNDNEPDLVLLEPNIETIEVPEADSDTESPVNTETSQGGLTEKAPILGNTVVKTEPIDDITLEHNQTNTEDLMAELHKRDTRLLQSISNIDGGDEEMDVNVDKSFSNQESYMEINNDKVQHNTNENYLNQGQHLNLLTNDYVEIEVPITMPQITNVFGNVNDTDGLPKISNVISTNAVEVNVEYDKKPFPLQENSACNKPDSTITQKYENSIPLSENRTESDMVSQSVDPEIKEPPVVCSNVENALITNPFLGVPTDLTFTDDGVELVDDGIEVEEEEDIIKCNHHPDNTDYPLSKINPEPAEESDGKFDLKLLMQPIVFTTKLDNITVLKDKDIYEIRDKSLIDIVYIESKPRHKNMDNIDIKQEISETEDVSADSNSVDGDTVSRDDSNSESEDLPEEMRVKSSSYLLQKPRSRSYNPIQLCKNPDFNTRLKRLTVGFLSSPRNRAMLRTVKPMTIDVSKAFESKLVKGTLYLKSSHNDVAATAAMEKLKELNEQMSAVLPSAMPAQCLINQTVKTDLSPLKPQNIFPSAIDASVPERNKTIHLPDIENIRRMNKRLYTAEITPMNVSDSNDRYKPPVQLMAHKEPIQTITNITNKKTVALDELPDNNNLNKNNQKIYKVTKKTPLLHFGKRTDWSTLGWVTKGSIINNEKPNNDLLAFDDALLTLDALLRMFYVINGNVINPIANKLSKNEKKISNIRRELEENEKQFEQNSNTGEKGTNTAGDIESPVEKKNEPNEDKRLKKKTLAKFNRKSNKRLSSANLSMVCCWARSKIDHPTMRRRHKCPRICICCCRIELADKTLRRIRADDSIPISDDEEIPAPNKPQLNYSNPSNGETGTLSSQIITSAESVAQKEISLLCHEKLANTNHYSGDEGDTNVITDTNVDVENKNKSLDNDMEIITIDDTEQIVASESNNAQTKITTSEETQIKMPRIKVLPQHALIAPTIQPIGKGNKYIQMIPESKKPRRPYKKFNHLITYTEKDKGKSMQKMLYLNSKQKKIGNASPIFLGPNKILLTEGKLPGSDPAAPKPTLQPSAPCPNVALPEGIELVLGTDGQLSFNLDSGAKLDSGKLAALPEILSLIQQQLANAPLSMLNKSAFQSDLLKNSGEVVNLIDDQISDKPTEIDNNLVSVPTVDAHGKNNTAHESQNAELAEMETANQALQSLAEDDDMQKIRENRTNVNAVETNVEHSEINEKEQSALSHSTNLSSQPTGSETVSEEPKEVDHSNLFIGSPPKPITDDLHISKNNEENKNTNPNSSEVETVPDSNETTAASTNTAASRNTLLSDLMEMSGISMEDMAPAPTVNQPSVIPLVGTGIAIPIAPKPPPLYLQTGVNVKPTITISPKKTTTELSLVSSFVHLKYACENKKKFFTLDLHTGVVAPINVCVRLKDQQKVISSAIDRPVIDLTNDIEGEESPSTRLKSLLRTSYNSVLQGAQPLKMFKSNKRKSKRKQKWVRVRREDASGVCQMSLEMNATEKGLNNKESESSDDEPLASKAKRMRLAEENVEIASNSNEIGEPVRDSSSNLNTDKVSPEVESEEEEKRRRDLPQEPMECEDNEDMEGDISFLYDDVDNGDCILGF